MELDPREEWLDLVRQDQQVRLPHYCQKLKKHLLCKCSRKGRMSKAFSPPVHTVLFPPISCFHQFYLTSQFVKASYLDKWTDTGLQNIQILMKLFAFSLSLGEVFNEQKLTAPSLPIPTPHSHKCTIMSRKQMQILTRLTKFIQHLYIKTKSRLPGIICLYKMPLEKKTYEELSE